MTDQITLVTEHQWRELRDERGRLWGRLDHLNLLLEVRRNHESVIFDLREYLDLRALEIESDIE